MALWPSTLPQVSLLAGWGEAGPFPVIQSDVDGPPLSRRRYTAAPTQITASVVLTAAQRAIWSSFYTGTVKHGSLPFTAGFGGGGESSSYRITGAPALTPLGRGYWRLNLQLIRLP